MWSNKGINLRRIRSSCVSIEDGRNRSRKQRVYECKTKQNKTNRTKQDVHNLTVRHTANGKEYSTVAVLEAVARLGYSPILANDVETRLRIPCNSAKAQVRGPVNWLRLQITQIHSGF